MRVLISGSSGLIGSALARSLSDAGHTVNRLLRPQTRNAAVEGDVLWDPLSQQFDEQAAEGADAVVHLAGASIGQGRWSDARKALLQSSRVDATRHLVSQFATLNAKPGIFVCASAVGYFGDRGEEKLTDYSGPGDDFLARLSRDWEHEAGRASEFGARVVTPRFGIVLSTQGGALPQILLPIKLFVGGRLGSGRQWMSWISLADAVGVLRLAVENGAARGAINAVAPQPIRNADFIKIAARVLHRPAICPAPAFSLRLMLGEMADGLLFSSQRVFPDKLQKLGYEFQDTDLRAALMRIIAEKK
jgi:uncharacterized protein (TIGR01777 family)